MILKLNSTNVKAEIWFGLIGAISLFSFMLYYLKTRRIIEYDDIKHILYVLDSKGTLMYEVPVEKIDKILFSSMGFDKLGSQYLIVFRDFHDQKRTVRFFTIPLRKDINTIIIDTKIKNPNLVTRNW